MDIAWSRWLVAAWAVIAAVWLAMATLLLVQTWPEPSVGGDQGALFENAGDEALSGRAMKGQANVPAAPAVREHIRSFLLFAIIPPAFLLALVWAALWVVGLPFPSLRRGQRDKLPSSR
jgi:hypothetical protein